LLALCSSVLYAQLNYDYTAGKFMIKGKVVDLQTQKGVPLANLLITNSGKGITCDNEGNFTIYVSMRDTLKFSSTGYLPKVIHVYDMDSAKYYTLQVQLFRDVIRIRDVNIYPYQDLDAFKKAFVDAKEVNKVHIPGLAPPKYSNKEVKPKFANPISLLYDRIKHRSNANPDFKP
jgi:hypothetical protein